MNENTLYDICAAIIDDMDTNTPEDFVEAYVRNQTTISGIKGGYIISMADGPFRVDINTASRIVTAAWDEFSACYTLSREACKDLNEFLAEDDVKLKQDHLDGILFSRLADRFGIEG